MMNLTAYKVVLRESKGVYHSAIELSKRNCVYYRSGSEAKPNTGANQFLCIFDTLQHARDFKKAVFSSNPIKALRKAAVILEVTAKRVTKTATALDGTRIKMKLHGHLFCKSLVVVRKV